MKYSRFAAALLSLLCIANSCRNESEAEKPENQVFQIEASFGSQTKTTLADNGVSILWEPHEEINVFYGSYGMKFTSLNSNPAPVAVFSAGTTVLYGSLEGSDEYIYGVYPYNPSDRQEGNMISINVPDELEGPGGTFASGSFPAIGRSKDSSMAFYNVCGGICFTVKSPNVGMIRFRGNNGETVSGRVSVGFDENGMPKVMDDREGSRESVMYCEDDDFFVPGKKYYMPLLPQVFENGYTITLWAANGYEEIKEGIISVSNKAEIKRSVFGTIENIDERAAFRTRSYIHIDKDLVNIPASGGSVILEVDASSDWYASSQSSYDWITMSPMEGKAGKTTIYISVAANDDVERDGGFNFFNQDYCDTELVIHQDGKKISKISEIKALPLESTIPAGTLVKAYVISNRDLNSLTSLRSLYIEDATLPWKDRDARNSGLYIYCPSTHNLDQGDVIIADLSGMKITSYNGASEIVANSNSFYTLVEKFYSVFPTDVSYSEYASGLYENQYVRITDPMQVKDSYLSYNWSNSSSHTSVQLETARGETATVFTSKYCVSLQYRVAQGSGQICGICTFNKGEPQLLFASTWDFNDLTHDRF